MTRWGKLLCTAAVLVGFGLPLAWLLATAFKSQPEFVRSPLGLPASADLANYRHVLTQTGFVRFLLNSVVVSAVSVALTLALAAPAAFVLSRYRFRGQQGLRLMLLFGLIVPIHITLLPLLKTLGPLGLANSLFGLSLVYAGFGLALTIFMLKNAFDELPAEIEDASVIDGCSPVQLFVFVALPLTRPALAVAAIYNFVMNFNEFAFALTLLNTPEKRTLPLGIQCLAGDYGYNVPALAAAMVLALVPAAMVFLVAQRQLVAGITSGAVKG